MKATFRCLCLSILIGFIPQSAEALSGCENYNVPDQARYCTRIAGFTSNLDTVNVRTGSTLTPYLLGEKAAPTRLRGRLLTGSQGAVLLLRNNRLVFKTPSRTVTFPSVGRVRATTSARDGAISPDRRRVLAFLLRDGDDYTTDRVVVLDVSSKRMMKIQTDEFLNPVFLDSQNLKIGSTLYSLPKVL